MTGLRAGFQPFCFGVTLHRPGVAPLLPRSLSSTNLIESCLSTVRHVARNVKRWRRGDHVARWTAAGLLEAERSFVG